MRSWSILKLENFFPKFVITRLRLCLFLIFCLAVAAGIFYYQIQPVIPLFYTLAQANQQLIPKEWIFLFPALALLITIINFAIIKFFASLEKLILELFASITVVIIGIIVAIFIRTILLVI